MMRIALAFLALLSAPAVATADVLDDIAEREKIRLGIRADAPPFSYLDINGTPSGLAVSLCREITALLSKELGISPLGIEFVTVTARDRFQALVDGRTDLQCGPASSTLARRQSLDFSILYFVDGASAAIRHGTYETVFDKRSGTFGVLAGTTTEHVVKDLISRNSLDAEMRLFDSHEAGLEALQSEDLDIYFGDQAILLFQIDALDLSNSIAVMEEVFSFEPYALAMKRGETRLRLAVDAALSTIYDEALIYRLILEELGNYPLPPEARAVYQIVGLPR